MGFRYDIQVYEAPFVYRSDSVYRKSHHGTFPLLEQYPVCSIIVNLYRSLYTKRAEILYSSNPQFKSNQISSLPQFKPLPIPATFFPPIHHSGQPYSFNPSLCLKTYTFHKSFPPQSFFPPSGLTPRTRHVRFCFTVSCLLVPCTKLN